MRGNRCRYNSRVVQAAKAKLLMECGTRRGDCPVETIHSDTAPELGADPREDRRAPRLKVANRPIADIGAFGNRRDPVRTLRAPFL